MNQKPARTLILMVSALVAGIVLMQAFFGSNSLGFSSRPAEKDLNWLYDQGKAKNIVSAVFQGDTIKVNLKDSAAKGEPRAFIRIDGENKQLATNIYDRLQKLDVNVKWETPTPSNMVFPALSFIVLPLMMFGLTYFLVIRPLISWFGSSFGPPPGGVRS